MTECLAHPRFGAQGQDIGAAVSIALAAAYPGVVAGIHLPGVVAFPPVGQPVSAEGQALPNLMGFPNSGLGLGSRTKESSGAPPGRVRSHGLALSWPADMTDGGVFVMTIYQLARRIGLPVALIAAAGLAGTGPDVASASTCVSWTGVTPGEPELLVQLPLGGRRAIAVRRVGSRDRRQRRRRKDAG